MSGTGAELVGGELGIPPFDFSFLSLRPRNRRARNQIAILSRPVERYSRQW
jgi:hypothetical protein